MLNSQICKLPSHARRQRLPRILSNRPLCGPVYLVDVLPNGRGSFKEPNIARVRYHCRGPPVNLPDHRILSHGHQVGPPHSPRPRRGEVEVDRGLGRPTSIVPATQLFSSPVRARINEYCPPYPRHPSSQSALPDPLPLSTPPPAYSSPPCI